MFTSDIRRKSPETFKELKERNYTIFNTKSEKKDYFVHYYTNYIDEHERQVLHNYKINARI
jgi:hypothetical protein